MTAKALARAPDPALYERDFYLWTQDQASRLRALADDRRIKASDLDLDHLAEEVADLGRSELNKVAMHLVQMLAHLLKHAWADHAEAHGHWIDEIGTQQFQAQTTFTPGMRQHLDADRLWRKAMKLANIKLTAYDDPPLPGGVACPFTLDDLLAEDFDIAAAREACARASAAASR